MAHIMHERAMLNRTNRSPFQQQQQQQQTIHQQKQVMHQQMVQQQQPEAMQVDAPQPRVRPNRWSTNKRTETTTTQQTTKTMSSTMSSNDQSQVMISEVDPNMEGCVLKG